MKGTKQAKYPGWRTMTGAQRYNARMHKLFDDAFARARAEGKTSPWDDRPRQDNDSAKRDTQQAEP